MTALSYDYVIYSTIYVMIVRTYFIGRCLVGRNFGNFRRITHSNVLLKLNNIRPLYVRLF